MTLTPQKWILAFAAALTTHTLAAVLPGALSRRQDDPPPPRPVLVSLTTAPAPVLPTPAVTPPAPVRPTPPVTRQPEPEVAPTPQPATAVTRETPSIQPSTQPAATAVNETQKPAPASVARPQVPPSPAIAAVREDNSPPTQETPAHPTTAVAPTPAVEAVDLARLREQYTQAAHQLLNRYKRYPPRAEYRREEGTAWLMLVVDRHGKVLDSKLEHSSGHRLLDQAALSAVRRAQRLPSLPDELVKMKDTIKVRVPISFKIP